MEFRSPKTNGDLKNLKVYNWDVTIGNDHKPMLVGRLDGFMHTRGGKWGDNCLYCWPREEKPTIDNITPYDGDGGASWGVEYRETQHYHNHMGDTYVETSCCTVITRNGKDFYTVRGKLDYSMPKAISIMKELDTEDGIGLIEKKRQGQGKPTMIYLKQFMVQDVQKCKNNTSDKKTVFPEVKKLHVLKCNSDMSRSEEITLPEVKKIHTNKNNINNTELSNTESNLIVSGNDGMRREIEAYSEIIRENIEIDILRERYPYEKELIDGIYDLILETVLCKNDVIIVASNRYPAELVRSKFLKLNSSHIEYAIDCFKSNTTKVRNIKKYLLTTLFNAPSTISGYYQAEVNHDFPQYAVIDK